MGVFGYDSAATDQVADAISDAQPYNAQNIKEALDSALRSIDYDQDPSDKSTFLGLVMELFNEGQKVSNLYIGKAVSIAKELQTNKDYLGDFDAPAKRREALKKEEQFLLSKISGSVGSAKTETAKRGRSPSPKPRSSSRSPSPKRPPVKKQTKASPKKSPAKKPASKRSPAKKTTQRKAKTSPKKSPTKRSPAGATRKIYQGERGGRYYISSSGKKVYIKSS